jgi:hypothetical protein
MQEKENNRLPDSANQTGLMFTASALFVIHINQLGAYWLNIQNPQPTTGYRRNT